MHIKGWTGWDYLREILSDRIDQSRLTIESFTKELGFIASAQLFSDNTLSSFTKFSPEQLDLERSMGGGKFGKILPVNVPESCRGKIHGFWRKVFKIVRFPLSGTSSFPYPCGYCWSYEHSHSRKINHNESSVTVKVPRRSRKVEIHLAKEGSGLSFLSTDLGHFFRSNVGNDFAVISRGKGPHKSKFTYTIVVRIHSLMIYTDLIEYKSVGVRKALLGRCFPSISKVKTWGQYNY